MEKKTIAILDDDEDILFSSKLLLNQYFESVKTFASPQELLRVVDDFQFAVLLLDLNYTNSNHDGNEGFEVLERMKKVSPKTEIVVMTAYAEIEVAVEAIKKGAFDFIAKPWQNERLLVTVLNALKKQEIEEKLVLQAVESIPSIQKIDPIIGDGEAMKQLRAKIMKLANRKAPILILGDHGCGKSLVAKHLHQQSDDKEEAFVEIDLATASDQYDQLFGRNSDSMAYWKIIPKGTIFLKNVNCLDRETQAQLSSKLKDSSKFTPRLICAAKDIEHLDMIEPLMLQLTECLIEVPALSHHLEDIADLVEYFAEHYARKHHKPTPHLAPFDDHFSTQLAWPLNVQTLKKMVERLILMEVQTISSEDFLTEKSEGSTEFKPLKLEEVERQHVIKILNMNRWNIQKSAADLDISRAALYRRIEKYQLSNEAL